MILYDETSLVLRYSQDFQRAFSDGTEIVWDMLFPTKLGGNFNNESDDWLYLTAWNRAGLGCEAMMAYDDGVDGPHLSIFDHSQPFSKDIAFSLADLSDHLRTASVGGFDLNALTVGNSTKRGSDGRWVNEVYLPAMQTAARKSLYVSDSYEASVFEQREAFGKNGTYGPTVEISRPPETPFLNLQPIGWTNAQVRSYDAKGNPLPWQWLTPQNTSIENGIGGLHAVYCVPNYTAVIRSQAE